MNINDMVEVELTESGYEIFKESPVVYQWGYNKDSRILKTELWVLFRIFGEGMRMGVCYFKNNEVKTG